MAINLSIKNVPDDIAAKLRERAVRNHRSLQGELMSILETVATSEATLSLEDIWARGQAQGLAMAPESTGIVRDMRDGRHGH
jgi:plasmid stability protein